MLPKIIVALQLCFQKSNEAYKKGGKKLGARFLEVCKILRAVVLKVCHQGAMLNVNEEV